MNFKGLFEILCQESDVDGAALLRFVWFADNTPFCDLEVMSLDEVSELVFECWKHDEGWVCDD